ncbi:MAG: MMPL family transporter [Proteobacteria bacterium]|nr:MMPL family transporter [Pseudomonadota bacterium]
MTVFIEWVLKWPKTVLLLLFVTTIFFAKGIPKLELDNSVEAFLPVHDKIYQHYSKTNEIYGDNGKFIIATVSHPDLFSREAFILMDELLKDIEEYTNYNPEKELKRVEKFDHVIGNNKSIGLSALIGHFEDDRSFRRWIVRKLNTTETANLDLSPKDLKKLRQNLLSSLELKKQELVDFILSPLTMRDISGKEDTLETYDLVEKDSKGNRILPDTEAQFDELKKKLKRNPAFEKAIYAVDPATGQITDFGMFIKFKNMKNQDAIAREITQIIKTFKGLDIIPMGVPIGVIQFADYMREDLKTFLPIVIMVVAIVFFFNFRSVRGVVLPFLNLIMAQIWTVGLMGYLGFKMTTVGTSIPALVCAVGSSYAIHIMNQYYLDFDMISEKGLFQGLRWSMSHISLTVILAAMTTLISFLTLAPSGIIAMSQWGIITAIGVFFALLIGATLIPASLMLMKHKRPAVLLRKNKTLKVTMIDRFITHVIRLSTRHYFAVIGVVAVLGVISAIGLSRVQVESDFMLYFKKNDPFRINNSIIEKKLVGGSGFNILIDSGKEEGIKDAAFLKTVEDLREWLTSDENIHLNIGRTDSFNDFIKTMNFAMNNDDPGHYRIPENTLDIVDYLELFDGDDKNGDGRIDEFESYVNPDFSTTNIIARTSKRDNIETLGTARMAKIIKEIENHLDQTLPSPYSYTITGFPVMNILMANYVVNGQLQSLLLSLIIIGIIVAILFSNVYAGFLSLLPMSSAVLLNFGIMGWLGINLDMVTSVIAAITIGIGVDDTIHFLNTFRQYQEKGMRVDDTIKKTLEASGKAIIYTSLALIFGFIVLTVSNFKPVILFGVLMALTMIATTVGALLILPAFIKTTQINLARSEAWYWKYLSLRKIFNIERTEPSL